MRKRCMWGAFFFLLLWASGWVWAGGETMHALSLGEKPRYGPDFTHFAYANPNAPKGGSLRMEALGSFDSFHPFIMRGVAASGLNLLFDTLMTSSEDEPFAMYPLLAESVTLAEDGSWVRFTLHGEARFHDGTPVLASDVAFSFRKLVSEGRPHYAKYYRDVAEVVVEDERRVRFDFKNAENPELPLILGQLYVLSEKDWEGVDFGRSGFRVPLGSGPYRLESYVPGRRVVYQRDPEYWGRDLPVNRGHYNFDRLSYEYFRDATVSLEAFKAGYYDLRREHTAKIWATQYTGRAFRDGSIVKKKIPHELPAGMQGFAMNVRRSLFQDVRVREALSLAFDFEWSNRALFYDQYTRSESYFSNSEMAAEGLPSQGELAYLLPLKELLSPEVFGPLPQPVESDGSGFMREALLKAADLLREAGYDIRGGELYTPEGQPFTFEILLHNPAFERVMLPYVQNLRRLGILARVRVVEPSQYIQRLRSFDFDMTVAVFPQSLSPGNEQQDFWSCKAAETPGSRNVGGICDPAVDALVQAIATASDRRALMDACRSLDRVLRHGHYVVPNWHTSVFRLAHRSHIAMPAKHPPYGLGLWTWWDKNARL
ncbi:microcin C transport system substrate-binding protein [Desulfobotulus alkaliphilus]|uniref:Microcin C transport system substrate-binding protein n=1 Tax=Desulfobotulus alkaliphilus TaxID=622671 RepID=A0A562S6C1_9BACT|nr:extracellular solute-binding protein [Desulfobotulus alkaliphilus]TWI76921.1 microcin C transport system substrate-binding protein [Desulfobotulus alkaliphilus]